MTNLMKSFAGLVAVLFTTSNAANAQWYSSNANPGSIGSVTIALIDDAVNACWTNLRDAREYAEEKLEIKGYDVVVEGGDYIFDITVNAERISNGSCYGSVSVQIWASNVRDGVFGAHEIGTTAGISYNPSNINNWVIEMISAMIARM